MNRTYLARIECVQTSICEMQIEAKSGIEAEVTAAALAAHPESLAFGDCDKIYRVEVESLRVERASSRTKGRA